MHPAIQLSLFWALAFVTLCSALVLLNIFDSIIGNDLVLHSLGKEAAIAGLASLVEGGCFWIVVSFVPAASRALIVPVIIVPDLQDWPPRRLEQIRRFHALGLPSSDKLFRCIFAWRSFPDCNHYLSGVRRYLGGDCLPVPAEVNQPPHAAILARLSDRLAHSPSGGKP